MLETCVTAINATTYFFLEGWTTSNDLTKTFFVNIETATLTPGPPMLVARRLASCSRMKNPNTGSYDSVVVAGGGDLSYGVMESTEILYLVSLNWQKGPDLPLKLCSSVMVEHFEQGVVVIGGFDIINMARTELYYLKTVSSGWQVMAQRLVTARFYPNAILLHESYVNCTG